MSKVTKVYDQENSTAYYFINGIRSEAYSDLTALQELLGEDFQELWLTVDNSRSAHDDEILSRMEAAETDVEFAALVDEYPHLVEGE